MSIPITFPVSTENFVEYQAELAGRPLSEKEREATAAWVPVFNDSFQEGRRNDVDGLAQGLERLNQYIEKCSESPSRVKFLKAARHWIRLAWERGREETP